MSSSMTARLHNPFESSAARPSGDVNFSAPCPRGQASRPWTSLQPSDISCVAVSRLKAPLSFWPSFGILDPACELPTGLSEIRARLTISDQLIDWLPFWLAISMLSFSIRTLAAAACLIESYRKSASVTARHNRAFCVSQFSVSSLKVYGSAVSVLWF